MNNNKNKFYVLVVIVLVIIVVITVYAMRVKTWRKIEIEQRKKEKTSNRVQFKVPEEENKQEEEEIPQDLPCDLPPSPEIFSDSGREGNEIFISWSPVSDIQKYIVYLKEMTEGTEDVSQSNYDQKITVKPDTWYYVFSIPEASTMIWTIVVNAVNDCGESNITNDVLRIS
jgi:hypothetical protein